MKKFYGLPLNLSLAISLFWTPMIKHEDFNKTTLQKLKKGEILSNVQLLPNSKVFKCKLIGLIPVSAPKVWKVISDYSHYHEFMPRTPVTFVVDPKALNFQNRKILNWNRFEIDLKQHRVKKYGKNPLYFYNRFKLPFPLKDRHFVLKVERFPEKFKSQWIEIIGNTRVNEGSWMLVSLKNDPENTLAIYTLHVDPGLFLPRKMIQRGIEKLPEVIRSLRNHILENEL